MSHERTRNTQNREILDVMKQIEENIRRDLPEQRKFLDTHNKLNSELDFINLTLRKKILSLDALKLEFENVTKEVGNLHNEFDQYISDILGKQEISTTEILAGQRILVSSEELAEEQEELKQNIIKEIRSISEEFKQSPVPNMLSSLQKTLQTDLTSAIGRIEEKINRSPVPQQIDKLQADLLLKFSEKVEQVKEKLDASPVPAKIDTMQAQLQTTIIDRTAVVQSAIESKLDQSPVPNLLHDVHSKLEAEIATQFADIRKKMDDSPVPELLDHLQKQISASLSTSLAITQETIQTTLNTITSPNFFKPVSQVVEPLLSKTTTSLQTNLTQVISQQAGPLGKEKSVQDLRKDLEQIQLQLAKTGKETSLEQVRKDISIINALPEIRKLQGQLTKVTENLPKIPQFSKLQNTVSQLGSQLTQIGKDSSVQIQTVHKTLQKQDAVPAVKALESQLQKLLSPLVTQKQFTGVQESIRQLDQSVKKVPSVANFDRLQKASEIQLPNKIDAQTKEIQNSVKELRNVSVQSKELLSKQGEHLNQLRESIFQRASAQELKEFKQLYEQTFPTMKSEIRSDLSKLDKEHQQTSQFILKAAEDFSTLKHATKTVPELSTFVTNDMYPQLAKGHQDLTQLVTHSVGKTQIILQDVESIKGKFALESSVAEIKKFASAEGFKTQLQNVKTALLPVIRNLVGPLAQQQKMDSLALELSKSITMIDKGVGDSREFLQTTYNVLGELRKSVDKLPLREEFQSLDQSLRHVISEKLPQLIEEALITAAKSETMDKYHTELRGDLKDIFQKQTILYENSRSTAETVDGFQKDVDQYIGQSGEQLKEISELVSEQVWDRRLEQIKAPLNRLAHEESLNQFKRYVERQTTATMELTEDIKQKVLVNQTKLNALQEGNGQAASVEDLSNLGEFLIDNIKKPLNESLLPKIQTLSQESTLNKNHEIMMEVLQKFPEKDDLKDLKAEQESLNKFLFKLLKFTEKGQEDTKFLEDQITALSEKMTLLFEFIKRVSGV